MYIKLLCIKTVELEGCYHCYENFTIHKGEIIKAKLCKDGVKFEFREKEYTLPYDFEEVGKYFISALDEEKLYE